MPDVMTVKDTAEYLKVSEPTVYRMIKDNQIPVIKVRGKYRFFKKALDEFLYEESQRSRNEIQNSRPCSLYTVK